LLYNQSMETKRTSLILITLVILVVAIFLLQKINQPEKGQAVDQTHTIASTSTIPYEIKSFTYASSSNETTVEYVQFAKMPTVNRVLEKEARDIFNKNVKDLETSLAEYVEAGLPLEGRSFVIDRTVERDMVFINENKTIVSVAYENYSDMGGAHGTFFFSSDTIDVAINKKLALSDILKEGYKTELTPYIKDKIIRHSETCIRCGELEGEIDPSVNVIPEHFVIQSDGIRLLYGAYELGPYVATSGGQELIIPKTDMVAYLAREW